MQTDLFTPNLYTTPIASKSYTTQIANHPDVLNLKNAIKPQTVPKFLY